MPLIVPTTRRRRCRRRCRGGVEHAARPGGDDRLGGDDLAEDRHRTDRQVDTGGDEHERGPAGHHGEHGDVLGGEDQVAAGEEAVPGEDREEGDLDGEDDQRVAPADRPDAPAQPRRPVWSASWSTTPCGGRRRSAPAGAPRRPAGVDGRLGHRAHLRERDVGEGPGDRRDEQFDRRVERSKCADRRPKRSTSTRSATSRTSGSVWRDQDDAEALVADPRMRSSTARLDHAEGGGRLVEEDHPLAHIAARAMATDWRWPPESERHRDGGSWTVVTPRLAEARPSSAGASPACW